MPLSSTSAANWPGQNRFRRRSSWNAVRRDLRKGNFNDVTLGGRLIISTLRSLSIPALLWVFGHGLWKATHTSSTSKTDPLYASCGVDEVSGLYGPGTWAAWILLVTACLVDRTFGSKKNDHEGQETKTRSILSGFDLNLLGALVYPATAAVDLLIHTHKFESSNDITEIGSITATWIITAYGLTFGTILCFMTFKTWLAGHSSLLTFTFCAVSTTLTICSCSIFDAWYRAPTSVVQILGFMPSERHWPHDVELGALQQALHECNFYPELKDGLSYGLFTQTLERCVSLIYFWSRLSTGIVMLIFLLSISGSPKFLSTGRNSITALRNILWTLALLIYFYVVTTVGPFVFLFIITFPVLMWIDAPIPISASSISDLDQAAAVIVSGAFVLIFTFADVYEERKVDAIDWVKNAPGRVKRVLRSAGEVLERRQAW